MSLLITTYSIQHITRAYSLVRDVDVLRVPAAGERPEAALVVELRHRLRLAPRPRPGLSLARDDLDRDLAPGLDVLGEPDGAGAAAAQRPQGPVAAEEEPGFRAEREGFRHDQDAYAVAGRTPFPAGLRGKVRVDVRVRA